MPVYGIYTLNGAGHVILPATLIEVENDEAAIEYAKQLQDGRYWRSGAGNAL